MYASVVVDDLGVVRVAFTPPEAEAPLIVDADAVLTLTRAPQFFEAIARRHPKVIERHRRVQLSQFPKCDSPDIDTEPANRLPVEETLRVGIVEAANHKGIITRYVMPGKSVGATHGRMPDAAGACLDVGGSRIRWPRSRTRTSAPRRPRARFGLESPLASSLVAERLWRRAL